MAFNPFDALSGFGKSLSGAGQSISGAFGNVAKSAPSFLQNPLMGSFNLGSSFGGQQKSPSMPNISMPKTSFGGGSGMSNMQGPTPPGFFSTSLSGAGKSAIKRNPLSITGPTPSGGGNSTSNSSQSWMNSIFPGGPQSALLGAGIMGAGQLLSPKTGKMPDINSLSSVQALQNFNPRDINKMNPDVEAAINRNLDTQFDQQRRELDAVYHNARPGTDYTTDSAYQRDLANLQSRQSLDRADSQANAQFQNMQTQLGANQAEMSRLSEIAQMDIYSIMTNLGISSEEAQQFKEQFGNVGGMFLTKSLFPDAYSNPLSNFKVS